MNSAESLTLAEVEALVDIDTLNEPMAALKAVKSLKDGDKLKEFLEIMTVYFDVKTKDWTEETNNFYNGVIHDIEGMDWLRKETILEMLDRSKRRVGELLNK